MHNPGRRRLIRNTAIIAPFLACMPSLALHAGSSRLRVAFIGTGSWGRQYLAQALQHRHLDVTGVCEHDNDALQAALDLFRQAGYTRPAVYREGPGAFESVLARADIDAVIIAAPWHQHYTIAKAALLAGKHVACGPVMGNTLEEHFDIVRTCKQSGRHYFTLEEDSYRRDLLAVSNMVSEGVFGELETLHAGARQVTAALPLPYPAYPGGAVAGMLDLPGGNRYTTIRAVTAEQECVINKPHPRSREHRLYFTKRPVRTAMLGTSRGQEVFLQSAAGQSEPLSTGFRIKGTGGSWMDVAGSVFINSKGSPQQTWEADTPYLSRFDHRRWYATQTPYRQLPDNRECSLALHHFVEILQKPAGDWLPVYTAATNSAIGLLAEQSAEQGGAVMTMPDFSA
ncbi:gfo/Idh/MocA family oxidoreductase [Chitinophaga lutea]|uniref:Gfo/Idh/MocA family oxidoreductase n=1 Tax=Chitinophaga lutea TaxID=2488634 RepID=A0A3N4PAG1_9BACT|nr:Gfo/Idh/MocA family oxidoreductase [Chitinophaga lutea]RPE05643.1 gfo/Idh/MocA family oxidoreductase [Chitinophaga lutea]